MVGFQVMINQNQRNQLTNSAVNGQVQLTERELVLKVPDMAMRMNEENTEEI
jgi:hypothetical protein